MKTTNLDIDLLRTFAAVADAGGFTAGGEVVARTQSAVSLQIKKLEESLGQRLFNRTSRSVRLTTEGHLLLGYARKILALNDESVRRISEPSLSGTFRLGIAEFVLPDQLHLLLGEFSRAFPQVHLSVQVAMTRELAQLFAEDRLDAFVGRYDDAVAAADSSGVEPLWDEATHWVAGGDFALPSDAPLPLILSPDPCSYRVKALQCLEQAGRSWRLVYTSSSVMGIQAAIAAGLGVAPLGRAAVLPSMRLLGAADGLPALPPTRIGVFGLHRAEARVAAALVKMLSEAARRMRGR